MKKFIFITVALTLLCACSNTEKEARSQFNEAKVLITEGEFETAERYLLTISNSYKSTAVATEALDELSKVRKTLAKKRDSKAESLLREVSIAINSYYADTQKLPTNLHQLDEVTGIPAIPDGFEVYYIGNSDNFAVLCFNNYGSIAHAYDRENFETHKIEDIKGQIAKMNVKEEFKGMKYLSQ